MLFSFLPTDQATHLDQQWVVRGFILQYCIRHLDLWKAHHTTPMPFTLDRSLTIQTQARAMHPQFCTPEATCHSFPESALYSFQILWFTHTKCANLHQPYWHSHRSQYKQSLNFTIFRVACRSTSNIPGREPGIACMHTTVKGRTPSLSHTHTRKSQPSYCQACHKAILVLCHVWRIVV